MLRKILYTTFTLFSFITVAHAQQMRPGGLMCDLLAFTDQQVLNGYPVQPGWTKAAFLSTQSVRIANRHPAFSWSIAQAPANMRQSSYRILVASHPDTLAKNNGDMWDSREVKNGASAAVVYAGKELQPAQLYYWKVMVRDQDNTASDWSAPAVFFTDSVLSNYRTAKYPLLKTDQFPAKFILTDGVAHADFGKAAFGQLKLTLTALKDNDTVVVQLGEAILANGHVNSNPGGTIRYQRYVLPLRRGTYTYQVKIKQDMRNTGPQAIKMPAYIGEVLPFRYCDITGYKGRLKAEEVVRAAVNYPFDDQAAVFESPDSVLNAVWELCKYSMKATSFAGTYVDGDRERIPYEADAYINQLGHYATDREYTLARSSHEYLLHHATWPTEWILQSVLMAYHDYLYTGDGRSARHYYNDLKAKLLMPLEMPNGLISTRTGKQTPALMEAIHFNGGALRDIVDWPHTGILGLGKAEGGETDGFIFKDYNAVVNAYYYKALRDMETMAKALDKTADAGLFGAKAEQVRKNYRKYLWDKKRKVFVDGIDTTHASLHTNMFALSFGLVEPAYEKDVAAFIRSRGMACSVYGSQFLMDAVYDGGDETYGLQLLRSTDERSWYNMVRAGSTIAMEAWDNKYKPNQDWNHAWGAVPANIIPRKLMGIEPLSPAWATFRIKPQIADLPWARLQAPTIKGPVKVFYEQDGDTFSMKVEIPANTTAQVVLPARFTKKSFVVKMDGQVLQPVKQEGLYVIPAAGSGAHDIVITPR